MCLKALSNRNPHIFASIIIQLEFKAKVDIITSIYLFNVRCFYIHIQSLLSLIRTFYALYI